MEEGAVVVLRLRPLRRHRDGSIRPTTEYLSFEDGVGEGTEVEAEGEVNGGEGGVGPVLARETNPRTVVPSSRKLKPTSSLARRFGVRQ